MFGCKTEEETELEGKGMKMWCFKVPFNSISKVIFPVFGQLFHRSCSRVCLCAWRKFCSSTWFSSNESCLSEDGQAAGTEENEG